MLTAGGPELWSKIAKLVQKMWMADPEECESIVHEADVIALHKKGDRSQLDNCIGICLLQIMSRLIARIKVKRLSMHLNENGILSEEQWGFRKYRFAVD